MKTGWLVTTTAAATLGITGLVTGLLGEAKAVDYGFKKITISATADAAQKLALRDAVEPVLCPVLNARFGLSGGDACSLASYFKARGNVQPRVVLLLAADGTLTVRGQALMPWAEQVSDTATVEAALDGGS